ncbi:MAG: chitobiase/beta-hexosaminidase C-terminal domain-containing protein [Muribaculaceae bacterium]|nr:chitobiase/beta-hexosaminidase C-terminal domain-containing protein [Muribaculaceae bacterium]
MRKFLSLFAMCLFATIAWAGTVTVDLTAQGYTNSQEVTTLTVDGVTLTFDKGTNSNTPKWYDNGSAVRLYGGGTLTVSATQNITQIVFTITQGDQLTADVGTYESSTWTGNASTIVFTQGGSTGHVRIQKLEVTTGGSGEITVGKPTFTPAEGTYYNPINVTIKCGTAGASIYYTTNGTTPTTSSTLYSGPVTISTTTTVKAIAALDGKTSEVATAEYVIGSATEVANIAAYQAVDDNTVVKFTNPVTVLAQYVMSSGNNRLFVQDATGNMFIYGKVGQTYTNGMQIPAGFTGTKITYRGEAELSVTEYSNFQAGVAGSAVEPEVIQAIDVEADLFGHLVYIAGATLGYTTSSNGNKSLSSISDNSGQAAANNSMGMSISDWDATYNVTAVIGSYKTDTTDVVYEVWPVKLEKVGGTTPSDGIATIAEYIALADNATFTFTGNAVVTYVNSNDKRYLYIKDNTGSALIYGTGIAADFKQGDVLASGWTGKKSNYNGLYEITSAQGLAASGTTQTVTPVEKTTSDVIAENQNIYCVLRNVTISSVNGRAFTFSDGTAGYNTFNGTVTLPSVPYTGDIEGFISVNNNNPQFIPTKFLTGVTIPKVADIATLYEQNQGVTYELEADLTAIYKNGSRLYVKDADTYTLVYGYMETQFENGDIIRGAQASWTEYQGAPQLTPVVSTFVVAESGTPVQPEVMAIEELGTDMVHMYVRLNNVALVNDSTKYATVTDETGSIQLYNQFSNQVTLPEDGTCNVIGFVSLYKGNIQMYPVEFPSDLPFGDVTGDKMVDVEDVNAAINIILHKKTTADYPGNADLTGEGMIDVEDVNMMINIILNKI